MLILSAIFTGIIVIFILSVLILVHETGHFLAARIAGVRVEIHLPRNPFRSPGFPYFERFARHHLIVEQQRKKHALRLVGLVNDVPEPGLEHG